MTAELQQRVNIILLSFISVMLTAFAALLWAFYGSLPQDVSRIREDVSDIKAKQGALAQVQDARMARMEKDLDKLEARVR